MKRKFELANGIIVEESPRMHTITDAYGFSDGYVVIDHNGLPAIKNGEYICLSIHNNGGLPQGGAYGCEFDVAKELK